jgi:hypothetical protein
VPTDTYDGFPGQAREESKYCVAPRLRSWPLY